MADGVRCDFSNETAFLQVFFKFAVDRAHSETSAPFVEKDGFFVDLGFVRLCVRMSFGVVEVIFNPFCGHFCDWDDSFFSSLSENPQAKVLFIDVLAVEAHEFADAQPATVKQLHDAAIPKA